MTANAPVGAPSRVTTVVALAVIAVAVVAAYANSFSGPFVFDDASSIVANPTIRHLSWAALAPPNTSVTAQGRPVLNLSLALNYAISGTNPWSYHALNVAIHLFAAFALFGVVRLTLLSLNPQPSTLNSASGLAFTVALLWAVHPLQTEGVTYTIQRAESLMGLFFLLTFYCFARAAQCHPIGDKAPARDRRAAGWFALAVASSALGMATKEVTVVVPPLVLLYDRTFVSGTFRDALRRHRGFYAALASTWLLLAALVLSTGGDRGGSFGNGLAWWAYPLTQFQAITRYLALAVWPHPLVFEYGTYWVTRTADVIAWVLPVAVLLVATAWALVRRPALGFLGAWFFVILAPTSLAPGTTQMIVEHRMYLPLAAVLLAVVVALHAWLKARAVVVTSVAAALLALATFARNADYRSETALWRDTVEKRPENPLAHQMLALALDRAGDTAGALAHYEAALQLKPNFALAHDTLGLLLFRLGRREEAAAHFEAALRLQPEFADAHDHLGVALARQRHWAEAIAQHEAALRLKPDFPDAHFNLANVLAAAGRAAEAAPHFEAALRLRPDFAAAHYNFANLLADSGRPAEAVPHYEAAVKLRPDYAEAYNNLGGALLDLGRRDAAIAAYEAALRLNPNFADARENLIRARAAPR